LLLGGPSIAAVTNPDGSLDTLMLPATTHDISSFKPFEFFLKDI